MPLPAFQNRILPHHPQHAHGASAQILRLHGAAFQSLFQGFTLIGAAGHRQIALRGIRNTISPANSRKKPAKTSGTISGSRVWSAPSFCSPPQTSASEKSRNSSVSARRVTLPAFSARSRESCRSNTGRRTANSAQTLCVGIHRVVHLPRSLLSQWRRIYSLFLPAHPHDGEDAEGHRKQEPDQRGHRHSRGLRSDVRRSKDAAHDKQHAGKEDE